MKGTELIKIYDDIKREIHTQMYIVHPGNTKELVWNGKEPYPMSHHVDDLGCDMRCMRHNEYIGMDSCSRCMEGGIKWQDSKNITANT